MRKKTILYIHWMGGGLDSRIPGVLRQDLGDYMPEDIKA